MILTSLTTIMEMTRTKPRSITIKALTSRAVANAKKQATALAISRTSANPSALSDEQGASWDFGLWMSSVKVAPHFKVGNAIGLDVTGAYAIKNTYISTYLAVVQLGVTL